MTRMATVPACNSFPLRPAVACTKQPELLVPEVCYYQRLYKHIGGTAGGNMGRGILTRKRFGGRPSFRGVSVVNFCGFYLKTEPHLECRMCSLCRENPSRIIHISITL
jgi:hypothetical protein